MAFNEGVRGRRTSAGVLGVLLLGAAAMPGWTVGQERAGEDGAPTAVSEPAAADPAGPELKSEPASNLRPAAAPPTEARDPLGEPYRGPASPASSSTPTPVRTEPSRKETFGPERGYSATEGKSRQQLHERLIRLPNGQRHIRIWKEPDGRVQIYEEFNTGDINETRHLWTLDPKESAEVAAALTQTAATFARGAAPETVPTPDRRENIGFVPVRNSQSQPVWPTTDAPSKTAPVLESTSLEPERYIGQDVRRKSLLDNDIQMAMLDVEEAELKLEEAVAELQLTERALEQAMSHAERKSIPQSEVIAAQAAREAAKRQVRAAELGVKRARLKVDRIRLDGGDGAGGAAR